jgi:nicotinamide-nucleotide amidase
MATDHPLIAIDDALVARAIELGDALRARGWRLATAESCTGGLLAGACTAPAGASDWFEGGFVTYGNAAKHRALGVPMASIERHGAVSGEVAEAMARGARVAAGVPLALSITGIAGPGGGSADKPVGTVWLGLAWRLAQAAPGSATPGEAPPAEAAWTQRLQLHGDRASIRAQTVAIALERLLRVARGEALP